ncbi:MAG TPA: nucleoside triphosphate pyrophosphohydrolase [Roseiflexaceae bacterium]|nr:nucleoside triphosphate pyrophosphohydrolase [Roseiflexaceae bacterium]
MAAITILGLGPGDAALLTRAAWDLLQSTRVLYLRTAIHPTVAQLPPSIELRSFDVLYEEADDFGAIYERIAAELVECAQQGEEVVYAVPGHPLVAEATTQRLLALARERGVPTRIMAGMSFVEPVCTALELDPLEHGLQLIDALDLLPSAEGRGPRTEHGIDSALSPQSSELAWSEIQGIGPYMPPLLPFPLVPTRPALVCQLYNDAVASHVKLSLLERYPAAHPVTLVRAAGVPGEERVRQVPLHELDHQRDLDHLTCAYLPPLAPLADLRGPEGIVAVFTRLLGPGGCPWDREQTHQSLRSALLEEAHEVLEALDADDMAALAEELGDLLGHIVSHSEMARQAGLFDLGGVYEGIAAKLIRRHPHVFGDLSVSGTSEVLSNWDAIKQAERAAKGQSQRGTLDGIPAGLPALATAQELTRKAAKVGFDWDDVQDAWDKLHEEIGEIREVAQATQTTDAERARQLEEEFGDLFLIAAKLAWWLHVDAESALRVAGTKFRRRYEHVERQIQQRNLDLKALSVTEKIALWEEAKSATAT